MGPKEVKLYSGWKPPALSAGSLHLVWSGSHLEGKIKTMEWAGPRMRRYWPKLFREPNHYTSI